MRSPICRCLLALSMLAGCSQTSMVEDAKELQIPQEVKIKLRRQAATMVDTRMDEELFTYRTDTLRIPAWAIDRVCNAMSAIWLSKSLERDSVFDIYKLEPFSYIDLHRLYGECIDTVKYAKLLTTYGLYTVSPTHGDLKCDYWTDGEWNTFAVSNKIMEGLEEADYTRISPDYYGGGGDQVRAWLLFDGVKIEFELGYGDCFGGCISRRYWTFKVLSDGTVDFLGVRGSPPWTR
jgi:hypothetical protein